LDSSWGKEKADLSKWERRSTKFSEPFGLIPLVMIAPDEYGVDQEEGSGSALIALMG